MKSSNASDRSDTKSPAWVKKIKMIFRRIISGKGNKVKKYKNRKNRYSNKSKSKNKRKNNKRDLLNSKNKKSKMK